MAYAIIYNHSLIRKIQELQECSIEELKKAYLPPRQPGVVQSITVRFDQDLKELEKLGAIEVKDGRVKYLKWPTPQRMYV